MRNIRGLGRGGRLVLALAVGVAVFGIATAVQASIPDAQGLIHGCYAKNGGALRVIDTGANQACDSRKETALNWNQRGATGSTGAQGVKGPQGPPGPSGAQGVKGPQGPPGPSGPSGAQGMKGPQGPAGATGARGSSGTNGTNGATGATGARGPSGTNGTNGATGATGPEGPTGSAGSISTYTNQVDFHVAAGSQDARTADCNPGDQVTGGGFFISSPPAHAGVSEPTGQGWFVDVEDFEGLGTGVDAAVFARCIHIG